MENFYLDNEDMLFHLKNLDLRKIIALKESNYADGQIYADAPIDSTEALENYEALMNLLGEISGQYIAPLATEVDRIGATFEKGEVIYAPGTLDAVKRLQQAGVMGVTIPRKFGGLNMPKILYSMAIELISRADASLMTIFGLQEIAETIHHFGSQEQQDTYLPLFCRGEVMGAMALTEPDAGSDLPNVKLKAYQDDKGQWYLDGVKRFITNGCASVILVMARSEDDIDDARGLSLFIYRRDENMTIRRIEDKYGIHGSPTCELQFNKAPAELLGVRKRGLIKYTMSLMNGARLGVSAQAVGIAEAAYREAREYASKRIQFSRQIDSFPPVFEMLSNMKVNIEAARSLLYEASCLVDMKEGLEQAVIDNPEQKMALKRELRKYENYESLFTPMLKFFVTEKGNQICYDALQVHGGVGYTRDFIVERLTRDMRITSIYEGTSQLQVVAAIGALFKGVASERLDEYEAMYDYDKLPRMKKKLLSFRKSLESALEFVRDGNDGEVKDFHSRRLVQMAALTINSYLLTASALSWERKEITAKIYMEEAEQEIHGIVQYIHSANREMIDSFEKLIS